MTNFTVPPPLPIKPTIPPPLPSQLVIPPVPYSARRQLGKPRTSLVGLAAIFAVAITVLQLVGEGMQIGSTGLRWTLVLTLIPVPFYLMLVLWLDRIEKEPAKLLIFAFVYGGTFATCFAGQINSAVNRASGMGMAAVVSAPLAEEMFKGAFLFGLFLWKRDEFDGVLDGVVYAAVVALGFATFENIEYYGHAIHLAITGPTSNMDDTERSLAVLDGKVLVAGTFLVRGIFSPFIHPLMTSMTGIGFGIASQTRSIAVRFFAPIAGYVLAVTLHALWNGSQELGGPLFFLAAYLLIFTPTFIGLIVLTRHSLKKEAQVVRDSLMCDVDAGYLSRSDYDMLCTLKTRTSDLRSARKRGGKKLRKLHRAFQQTATDLAFYRFRVNRGIAKPDSESETAYFQKMHDIQHHLTQGR